MKSKLRKSIDWLLPVFLILFVLEVIAFPIAAGITYAGRSENPDHVLTYTPNRLTWNSGTDVAPDGTAQLSIFDAEYPNVSSDDKTAVVAPGTEALHMIRLKNASEGTITFHAVVYSIKSSESLPVEVSLGDGDFTDSQAASLPYGVNKSQVIRSVSGHVKKDEITDFDIHWLWNYELDDQQDMIDVNFGDKSADGNPDDITVGFYLVVEDNNGIHIPKTGDTTNLSPYICLLCISGVLLLFLMIFRKLERKKHA